MARIRIHELAKKLGKENKEILNYLTEKGIQVKSPMNSLEEEQVAMVEDKFGKKETKPEGKAEAAEEKKAPAKKKNITQVFHPQNSRTGIGRGTRGSQNRTEGQQGRRNDGQKNNRQDGQTQNRDGQNRTGQQGGPRRDGQNGGGRFRDGNNDSRNQGQGRRNDGQNRTGQQGGPRRDGQNGGGRFRDGNNDSRNQGQGRRNDGQRPSGGRNQGSRMGGGSAVMEKPITKESRNRNDRGRNDRQDKVDKFESKSNRLGQGGKNNSKNNNGRGGKNNKQQVKQPTPPVQEKKEDEIKTITLPETMTIKELADAMKIQASAIIKKLFLEGVMVTVNQEIDFEKAEEIALEFNCIAEKEEKVDVIEELLHEEEEDESTMVSRPPVVCVMGHVDHGKTSLLDAIRETHVTAKESGGITQKIGAYTVSINDHLITFLDTPGHEAFTAMRMRGAQATDIAILVVAADDGVMPQTIEAINHAKAAGVEIIVAVNKIDKPSANIEKVKQELTEYELIPEDWGGSTIFVPVSAHTKEGIDDLLEMILLTAEVQELKANPNRKARGIVIEAELDKGRGPVATVLVQKGTLKVGDHVAAGACHGKIRAMVDDKGHRVREAGPSIPVEILGLNDVPNAGEILVAMDSDKEARNFAETFISEGRKKLLDDTKHKVSLDALFEQIQAGNVKELGIIIKADVQGSVEAVKQSLVKLSNEEVVVKIIHGGVGNINESDVVLASASNAIIIGFNVKPDNQARIVAEREKVDLRLYSVIYNAIEDVESALKGMLEPIYEEQVIGHVEIRQIFKASGVGNIAGSFVTDGKITRNASVRITREGEKTYEGPIASLKRFKDEVKEVKAGYECGLVFEKFNDIQEGDIIEAYEMVEVPR